MWEGAPGGHRSVGAGVRVRAAEGVGRVGRAFPAPISRACSKMWNTRAAARFTLVGHGLTAPKPDRATRARSQRRPRWWWRERDGVMDKRLRKYHHASN